MGPGKGPRRGPRMFGRGAIKYALLDLLQERPKHGYEMMKELEDRSGGFYAPSAGAIYPTLQLLEDRGWVTSQEVEGKRVYSITDAGRAELADFRQRGEQFGPGPFGPPWAREGREGHHHHHYHEHGERGEGPREREREWRGEEWRGPWWGRGPFGWGEAPEWRGLMREGADVAALMRKAAIVAASDPTRQSELLAHVRSIVDRAGAELRQFLDEAGAARQRQTPPSGAESGQSSSQGSAQTPPSEGTSTPEHPSPEGGDTTVL